MGREGEGEPKVTAVASPNYSADHRELLRCVAARLRSRQSSHSHRMICYRIFAVCEPPCLGASAPWDTAVLAGCTDPTLVESPVDNTCEMYSLLHLRVVGHQC
jgi:hypothetical protein